MSDQNKPAQKEEVVVLAGGVRARMMAYQQEIQRKEKASKTAKPVFKVADDLGVSFHSNDGEPLKDKMPLQDDAEMSIGQAENDGDESHVFQRSMNAKDDFFRESIPEEELEEEAEKPQEVKDEEEKEAKEKISRLLSRDEDAEEGNHEEPVVMQAFTAVQRRYLRAIGKLRPEPLQIKKEVVEQEEKAPEHKEFIRKTLSREMTKSAHLTELTSTWDDYYEKAQDKPTEEEEVKQVEEEIKQVEEQVNTEWTNFAEQVIEQVVEIVGEEKGDDDSVGSEDSDMVKWREEARRLKAEAEERKKQKAAREERKKKRAQIAALRKKRAEEAAARKKAEEATRQAEEAARLEALAEAEAAKRLAEAERKRNAEVEAKKAAEAARKKAEESDSDSSGSSDDSSSAEPEPEKPKESKPAPVPALSPPPSPKKASKQKAEKVESDSESSEDNRQTKKKSKKKKEKEKEKEIKEKDILKVKEKKKKSKKKGKKKGDDDSDLDDGWVEEYPRNFDGTLWRNPLKFWTNKPTKLNEVAPKVIMRPNPNSDIFCKSEDAINDNASFYWNKFQGDFNVLVKIKGSLNKSYDKAGIMVRQDERNWVMSGLEFFNQRINHSSCITRGISDWSLAPLPEEAKDGIWVAIKRHDNKVECFYSYDLKEWIQTRQGLFPTNQPLKVGIVAACPMGESFKVVFERFRIQMVG